MTTKISSTVIVLLLLFCISNNMVLGNPRYDESVKKAIKNFEVKTGQKINIPNWVPSENNIIKGVSDERQLIINYSLNPTPKTNEKRIDFIVFSKSSLSDKNTEEVKLNNGTSAYFRDFKLNGPKYKGMPVNNDFTLHFKKMDLLYLLVLHSKETDQKTAQILLLKVANSIN